MNNLKLELKTQAEKSTTVSLVVCVGGKCPSWWVHAPKTIQTLFHANLLKALNSWWCLLFSSHKVQNSSQRIHTHPPTHPHSSTLRDTQLQNNSLVIISMSYSVFVQKAFVKHGHLFAVEGPSAPWREGVHSGSVTLGLDFLTCQAYHTDINMCKWINLTIES